MGLTQVKTSTKEEWHDFGFKEMLLFYIYNDFMYRQCCKVETVCKKCSHMFTSRFIKRGHVDLNF